MNASLKKLRIKYIVTASAIVFAVIMLMVVIINLLMRITYRNEQDMIENTIGQAAAAHINQPFNEHYRFEDAERTENGEFIIPRNVRDISEITVHGRIECSDKSAIWYSAGGGLLFQANTPDGVQMVYKDYSFSKDTTNVSIDFEDYDNVKLGYQPLSIKEEDIVGDSFLVSAVWWRNSSSVPEGNDKNVKLDIEGIDIHYKEGHIISTPSGQLVSHISFSEVFENDIPSILNNAVAFYLIADGENRLVSVNDGNLAEPVKDDEAREYLKTAVGSGSKNGKIKRDGAYYSYSVTDLGSMNLVVFINDNYIRNSNVRLLWISLSVGIGIWIILFIFIFIVSKHVIKPVAENMERQKQFISNASHELKTPITVIFATIDIIGSKKGEDCWTECIREQAKKMQRLVSEMLDLSRLLEVHTARSGFEECDISSVVNNSLLYFESLFFESQKELDRHIEENISMLCDENKISQLVGILIDNALKYSDAESTIEFSLSRERDSAVIKCANLCSEFSANDTTRLFERFYRSDNDRIHEQEGFGLGLAIAQAISELHGGSINADYKNKKITFTVIMPLK